MDQDETFIASLLAKSSRDTARLAYVEWLDARDKRQAEYLRTEAAWAQARTRDDEASLRALAAGLDPVWVARVSRPPLGVCADHLQFTDYGEPRPKLSATDLRWIEDRFKVTFPADYQGFLLNYNGGYVAPGHFRIPGRSYHEWAYETLVYLCPVWAAVETEGNSDSDLVAVLKAQEELRAGITMFGVDPDDELSQHWRAKPFCDLMQIGKGPPSGGLELVCLGGRGSALGRVYLVSPWPEPGDEEICEIAPTFASFLGMLTDYDPDHVKAIKTGDVATLRRWLDAGGDPNEVYRNMPLLSWGIFHAQPESVRELLLRGVKVYDGARNHATGCQQVMELLDHFSRK